MATTPLFTAIVSGRVAPPAARAERPSPGSCSGSGPSVFLLGGSPIEVGPATVVAVAAGLGAALSYAFAGTFVRRRLGDVAPLDLATGQLVAAAVILLPISLLSGIPPVPSPAAAGSLVTMGVVSTAIAWLGLLPILSRTTATAASSSTFLVPMFGIVWGGLILGEHVGPELLAGFALVIVSLVLVLRLPVPGRTRCGSRSGGSSPGRPPRSGRSSADPGAVNGTTIRCGDRRPDRSRPRGASPPRESASSCPSSASSPPGAGPPGSLRSGSSRGRESSCGVLDAGGAMSQADLARAIRVPASKVVGLVDELATAGLVERRRRTAIAGCGSST